MTESEWHAAHWANFIAWCEGEFIARTIIARHGKGPVEWRRVSSRLTMFDVICETAALGYPGSIHDLSQRYGRRRGWSRWMQDIDRRPTTMLQRHRAFKTRLTRHPQVVVHD